MLMDELNEILERDVEEVLKTPQLLLKMLRLYSEIFLNSRPCSTCEDKHRGYYSRLQREGKEQFIKNSKMEKTKYIFKNEGTLLQTPHGDYIQSTLTDKIVENLCKEFPALVNQFKNPPEEVKEVEPKKEVSQKPKQTHKRNG